MDPIRVNVLGSDNDIGRKIAEKLIWRGYEVLFVGDPTVMPGTWATGEGVGSFTLMA